MRPTTAISAKIAARLSLAALAVALAAYLAIGARDLALPGLYADEALDALPAMDLVLGLPPSTFSLHVGTFKLPLMLMPYVGAQHSWYLLPWFALFGPEVVILRLANLCLGAGTLVLIWFFTRQWLDTRAAGLTVLLLALDPGYVYGTRFANVNAFLVVPLALGTVWSLQRWQQTGHTLPLFVAGLCLGIGLAYKIVFLWIWLALGLSWLALSPALAPGRGISPWLWPWRRSPRPGAWLLAAGAVLLGAAPLLAYNLQSGGATFDLMRTAASHATFYGVNNRAYLANLGTVLGSDLPEFLSGAWVGYPLGANHRNPLMLPALVLSGGLLGYLALRGRLSYPWKRLALAVIISVTVLLLAPVTVSSLGAFHLVILWPWPQLLVAAALLSIWDASARLRAPFGLAGRLVAAALALLVAGWSLFASIGCRESLERSHGVGLYSDAIYALADDLRQAPAAVILDWGFDYNLNFLGQRRLPLEERYDYSDHPGPELRAWLEQRVTDGDAWYVLHAPQYTVFGGHYEALEDAAARAGLQPVLYKTYADPLNRPVIIVYCLEALQRLYTEPPITHKLQASLGSQIELVGYDLVPDGGSHAPGERLTLTLYWHCLENIPADYKVFVHLVNSSGTMVAQVDAQPQNWGHPTSSWQPGEYIPDRLHLEIPAEAAGGTYALYVGMYSESDGTRLPISQGGINLSDGRLPLAELDVR